MITSIEIPHLAKGQSIAQFKKVFSAATATLKPEQQLAEEDETEVYPVHSDRKFGNKDRPICDICKKTGHLMLSKSL